MRKIYFILFSIMLACVSCQWHFRSSSHEEGKTKIAIERYDRLEHHFLTSGDIAALQQMKTEYPVQTRTLIEDVLQLGQVDEPDINIRFLSFFQDSTLQALMADVEKQYADVSDIEEQLTSVFHRLSDLIPGIQLPVIYTQIGSLDQSIVAGEGQLGISLDKYLGTDYPLYLRYGYSERQRIMMSRESIVPDCLGFYLLSLYPCDNEDYADEHMAKIQYVVNRVLGQQLFVHEGVKSVERYMNSKPETTIKELLTGK